MGSRVLGPAIIFGFKTRHNRFPQVRQSLIPEIPFSQGGREPSFAEHCVTIHQATKFPTSLGRPYGLLKFEQRLRGGGLTSLRNQQYEKIYQ